MSRANEYIDAIPATLADLRAEVHALREALYQEQQARERAERELAELHKLAAELRSLLFEYADGTMQGGMIGSPMECIAFAKWWIQAQLGMEPDQSWFAS